MLQGTWLIVMYLAGIEDQINQYALPILICEASKKLESWMTRFMR
jgi:hypothetical protein